MALEGEDLHLRMNNLGQHLELTIREFDVVVHLCMSLYCLALL